jgi:hypothetical protein
MANPMIEFDHAVIRVNDFILAERFYRQIFGGIYGEDLVHVEHRSMNSVEEYVHTARTGGTGARAQEADAARGIETGDQSASTTGGVRLAGVGQGSVQIGGALIPMFLARKHEQEPPPEQLKGSPRHAFPVNEQQMAKAIELLRKHDVDFEGPVDHPDYALVKRSIYFKDPSSNFLELCVSRED